MAKIVKISQLPKLIKKIHQSGQKIVLVGGCFDLVHLGHLIFLDKAKQSGDVLLVLLESDQNISRLKGADRPINSQNVRAKFLTYINSIDFIIPFKETKSDQDYQDIINQIKPDIIAVTKDDPNLKQKQKEAQMINSQVVIVTNPISDQSTSLIIKKCYNTHS